MGARRGPPTARLPTGVVRLNARRGSNVVTNGCTATGDAPVAFQDGACPAVWRRGDPRPRLGDSLASAEQPVAGVAKTGENVSLRIELPVE